MDHHGGGRGSGRLLTSWQPGVGGRRRASRDKNCPSRPTPVTVLPVCPLHHEWHALCCPSHRPGLTEGSYSHVSLLHPDDTDVLEMTPAGHMEICHVLGPEGIASLLPHLLPLFQYQGTVQLCSCLKSISPSPAVLLINEVNHLFHKH